MPKQERKTETIMNNIKKRIKNNNEKEKKINQFQFSATKWKVFALILKRKSV